MRRIEPFNEFYYKGGILIFGILYYVYGLMPFGDVALNIIDAISIVPLIVVFFNSKRHALNNVVFFAIFIAGLSTIIHCNCERVTLFVLYYIAIEIILLPYCDYRKDVGRLVSELDMLMLVILVIAVTVAALSFVTFILNISSQYTYPFISGTFYLGIDRSSNALIGVYSNANGAAFLYVTALGALLYYKNRSNHKLLLWFCVGIISLLLILTRSRGGIIGFLIMLAFYAFSLLRSKVLIGRSTSEMFRFLCIISIIIFMAGAMTLVIRDITILDYILDSSASIRGLLWSAGIKVLFSSPLNLLFGVGTDIQGEIAKYVSPEVPVSLFNNMHNVYMQTLVSFGVIGSVLFLMMVIRYLYSCMKMTLSNYSLNEDLFPLLAVLFAQAVISLVESDIYMGRTFLGTSFWIICGYIFNIEKQREEAFKKN